MPAIIKGGVKKKNEHKKGFKPVFDMIIPPTTTLDILTYSSSSGFLFKMEVTNEDDFEYFTKGKSTFNVPVTSYILKFVIITPTEGTKFTPYKGVDKSSETKEFFYSEANIQQKAWFRSTSGNKPEVCPSIANFSLFDNINSMRLLSILKKKTSRLIEEKELFQYMSNIIGPNPTYGLGLIVMPSILPSSTFRSILTDGSFDEGQKNIVVSNLIAKIIRLFIEDGIIHFDLHSSNALVYMENSKLETVIIDFGRASDVTTLRDDIFLLEDEKERIVIKKDKYYDDLLTEKRTNPKTETYMIKYVKDVMNYITLIDREVNQQIYPGFYIGRPNAYQMQWYENYKNNDRVLLDAYHILKQTSVTLGDRGLATTMETYMKDGLLFDLRNPVDSYYVTVTKPLPPRMSEAPNPPPAPRMSEACIENESGEWSCTIMGGKNRKVKSKRRTHKRHRRTHKR
jgi:hypothetical protein